MECPAQVYARQAPSCLSCSSPKASEPVVRRLLQRAQIPVISLVLRVSSVDKASVTMTRKQPSEEWRWRLGAAWTPQHARPEAAASLQ